MNSTSKIVCLSILFLAFGACTSSQTREPSISGSASSPVSRGPGSLKSAHRGPASVESTCVDGPCSISDIVSGETDAVAVNRTVIWQPGKDEKTGAVTKSPQRVYELKSEAKGRSMLLGANNKLKLKKLQAGERPPWVNQPGYFNDAKTAAAPGIVRAAAFDISKSLVSPKNKMAQAVHPGRNRQYRATPITASELTADRARSVSKATAKQAAKTPAAEGSAKVPASIGSCSDDSYEYNDSMSSAYDLTGYENTWLSGIRGSGVQDDDDWYKIYVSPSYRHLIVDLRFRHSEGDIDLKVYDSSGYQVASSSSLSDDEYIDTNLSSGGFYYIKVHYADRCNRYDLLWSTGNPNSGTSFSTSDYYEYNDSRYSAYDLRGWRGNWLSYIHGSGVAVGGNDDWYKVEVYPGYSRIILDARFRHSDGDIEMDLYNDSGTRMAYSHSSSDDEYIDVEVPTQGQRTDYYVKIYPTYWSSSSYNIYDFRWDALAGGGDAAEDSYEPNDSRSPSNSTINENQSLTGTQGDDDWYRFYVSDSRRNLQISMAFVDSYGDIDLKLYDDAGHELQSSRGTGDSEYISYTVPTGNKYYYIKVYGNNHFNAYRLSWTSTDSGPSDDTYEPNDSLAQAFDFSTRENQWLSNVNGIAIQKNDDYYKIFIPVGLEILNFDMRFNPTYGPLSYELLRADGTSLGAVAGDGARDQFSVVMPGSGYYYIRVYGDGRGNTYNLKWSTAVYTRAEEPGSRELNSVEYYNTTLRHYFMTAEPGEMQHVETGKAGPGWFRTGQYFRVNPIGSGGNYVCRFYGTPGRGPNSHFYTANVEECNSVKSSGPGWTFEGIVFSVAVPTSNGTTNVCEAGMVPVYRVYNNRFPYNDSNHRYMTSLVIYQNMQSAGWAPEGIVFCSSKGTN